MPDPAPGTIRIGIGGWTYAPWRGTFFPDKLPHSRELEHAATRLTALEINATYYGRQKPETFAKWAAAVPDGFRFAVKASRYATARKKLADGAESVAMFLDQGLDRLGERLGPILWQLPATKPYDHDDLGRFLDMLPPRIGDRPAAHVLEARHASFADTGFVDLLRDHNVAIAHVDRADAPAIDAVTADFGYARLERANLSEPAGYPAADLDRWATRATETAKAGHDAYVFFIAGDKVRNPQAAEALIARLAAS
ncbi:DUF72 domain-containing protein [Sphingomonas montana]|uniref:DUF72 domain-containing protein n=1 Tax=Sphingomonas montana TaxID=1843236 RepID=UPI001F0B549D|nr:DUF72 domain-containing protein [Sphingomonas montana]